MEDSRGRALSAPLDTVSPVDWIGYANPVLAKTARPILRRLIKKELS